MDSCWEAQPGAGRRGTMLLATLLLAVSAMPPGPGQIHISPGCLAADGAHVNLWCPGDGGYECYKIPTLMRVPNTTELLAFIEARKFSCDDNGYVDLLLRRSHDHGKTWTAPQLIHGNSSEEEWHTIGDALPVYDAGTGAIHLVFTRDNIDAFVTQSNDMGATWKEPRNISGVAVRQRGRFLGTGHDQGLQLASGRLLVPMYGGGSGSFVLASDDHGASWNIIGEVNPESEWAIAFAERKGGVNLVGSIRSMPKRLLTWSEDGGETWTQVRQAHSLPEPVGGCEGAMFLHPMGRLFFSHPVGHLLRQVMEVWTSEDGGRTWQPFHTVWGPGAGCDAPCVPAAGYSSMVALGEDAGSDIGIFYDRNNVTMLIFEGRAAGFASFAPQRQPSELVV